MDINAVGGVGAPNSAGNVPIINNLSPLSSMENTTGKMTRKAVPETVQVERNRTDQKSTDYKSQDKQETPQVDMNQLMERLNSKTNNQLSFSVDKELNQTVVKVIDKETKEVLKQFPSEEAMKLSKTLGKYNGSLVKESA